MKLSNLFRRKPSREVAKDRLKILLISDRVNCSPEILEMIKKEKEEKGITGATDKKEDKGGNPSHCASCQFKDAKF